MTTKALLAAKAQIDPKKVYKGISFFKDQKPRDFTGAVLLQELKSLKNSLKDEDVEKLLAALGESPEPAAAKSVKPAARTEKPAKPLPEEPATETAASDSQN